MQNWPDFEGVSFRPFFMICISKYFEGSFISITFDHCVSKFLRKLARFAEMDQLFEQWCHFYARKRARFQRNVIIVHHFHSHSYIIQRPAFKLSPQIKGLKMPLTIIGIKEYEIEPQNRAIQNRKILRRGLLMYALRQGRLLTVKNIFSVFSQNITPNSAS